MSAFSSRVDKVKQLAYDLGIEDNYYAGDYYFESEEDASAFCDLVYEHHKIMMRKPFPHLVKDTNVWITYVSY